jgi:hypothetical protein
MADLNKWTAITALVLVALVGNSACESKATKENAIGDQEIGRVTPGEYEPPWISNLDADSSLASADNAMPGFTGSLIGIYLHPEPDDLIPRRFVDSNARCGSEDRTTAELASTSEAGAYTIDASYLPPGTFEQNPATITRCAGRLVELTRTFELPPQPVSLVIRRAIGAFAAAIQHAPRKRISIGTVDGKEAVLIHPVAADGWGDSAVILKEPYGVTAITAVNLPFDEVLRIAKGVGS